MSENHRNVLITGGSRGIGRAIAFRLAKDGARIGVNYLSHAAEARQVVDQIIHDGGEALALQGDVTQVEAVEEIFRKIQETWGPVEILVNNAGIIRDSLLMRMTDADWDAVVDIHLKATFLCTRRALREMVRNRWGRVINIGSVVGIHGNAGQANYAAAKAGVIGLTRSVGLEVANRNITVNYIAPGYMATDIVEELPQELKDRILARVPVGRFGQAEEVANLVGYIASDMASYITGQVVAIDGGMLIG